MSRRILRLNETIKSALSDLIQNDLKDPRLGFITITGVEVGADLRHAYVYISVLGEEKDWKNSIAGLINARKHLRLELGKKVKMKYVPEIEFKADRSIEEGMKIFDLIKKISIEKDSND